MILDCPACGAALSYDPESGKMKCDSCSNLYETFELQEDYVKRGRKEIKYVPHKTKIDFESGEMMECSIYSCTACGAEIVVNDVEVSTFCSYCGQPTLVFSRLENMQKPEYILPFKVTKEKALSIIKDTFSEGFFVPDDIKNIKMERIRGIYIPYFLYDIHYEDTEFLLGTVGSGRNSQVYCYYRKAECDFDKLALDASLALDDVASRKLNPYYTNYLEKFSPEYLSGFYADFFDANEDKLKGQAILRAKSTFEDEIKRCIAASDVKIIKSKPVIQVTGRHYALFPAWFATFINDGKPYTLMINGQTEKLVGGVPHDKRKVKMSFLVLWFFLSILLWCIMYPYLLSLKEPFVFHYLSGLILMYPGIKMAVKNFRTIKESRELTALKQTERYVKDRQEG